jgi:hypothetical protein
VGFSDFFSTWFRVSRSHSLSTFTFPPFSVHLFTFVFFSPASPFLVAPSTFRNLRQCSQFPVPSQTQTPTHARPTGRRREAKKGREAAGESEREIPSPRFQTLTASPCRPPPLPDPAAAPPRCDLVLGFAPVRSFVAPRGGQGFAAREQESKVASARANMKDPAHRTKVVLRRLPPTIAQQAVVDQVDARFAGRYDWVCFRPGNGRSALHLCPVLVAFVWAGTRR